MSNFGEFPNMGIEMTGNWSGLIADITLLPDMLKTSAIWGQSKYAEKLVRVVKGHIMDQDLNWVPSKKASLGTNDLTLYDTGTYYRSIKTWQQNYTRYIGVKKGIIEPKSKVEVWEVAAYHEYMSYNGGPFRGLWRPSFEELGGMEGIRKIVFDVLIKKVLSRPELSKYTDHV